MQYSRTMMLNLGLVFSLFCNLSFAAPIAGHVILAKGQVTATSEGIERVLKRRSEIFSGEIIKTGNNSSVQVRFVDKALMTIKPNSEMDISSYLMAQNAEGGQQEQAIMNLVKGGFRTITGSIGKGDKSAYKVTTPAASIGIRGTNYEVQQESNGAFVMAVYSGGISVENEAGTIELGLGSDFNFTRVTPKTSPKGLLSAPQSLSENSATEQGSDEETNEEKEEVAQTEEESDTAEESSDNGDEKSEEKTVVAGTDSGEGDNESAGADSTDGEAHASTEQAALTGLDAGVGDSKADTVAALDSKLTSTIEETKKEVEDELIQELTKEGVLAEGQTLDDLAEETKENLANLDSLDDLINAFEDPSFDITDPGSVPDPDKDPTTDPGTDPGTDPVNFIESIYTNAPAVTNPYPTVITDSHYNVINSGQLAIVAMPLGYQVDNEGRPIFNSAEAQIFSPTGINASNFTAQDFSISQGSVGFSIYYEVMDNAGIVTEYDLPIYIYDNILTPGDLEIAINTQLAEGYVYNPNDPNTEGVLRQDIQLIQQTDGNGDIRFVFKPTSSQGEYIVKMELKFWDTTTSESLALIQQLSGTAALDHDDWRADSQTDLVVSNGAWQVDASSGNGSPILFMKNQRTDVIDGNEVSSVSEEFINKAANSLAFDSLTNLALCADQGAICDILVTEVKGSDKIHWGAWMAEPTEPIRIKEVIEESDGTINTFTHDEENILAFWIAAERADINQLNGTATFSGEGICTNFSECIGFADDGVVSNFKGQFNVNFDSGAIDQGNLTFETTNDPIVPLSGGTNSVASEWSVNFSGQMGQNADFQTHTLNGTVKDAAGNPISSSIFGNIGGVFVKPGDVFAGGYNLGTLDGSNKHAAGVFSLSKQQP